MGCGLDGVRNIECRTPTDTFGTSKEFRMSKVGIFILTGIAVLFRNV